MGPLAVVARFRDAASADALVTFLAAHDIRAHVEGADPLSVGLGGRIRVVLAEEDLRRARWMMENADAEGSDGEAWQIATGELDAGAARRAFARSADGPAPSMQRTIRNAGIPIVLVVLLAIAALLSR